MRGKNVKKTNASKQDLKGPGVNLTELPKIQLLSSSLVSVIVFVWPFLSSVVHITGIEKPLTLCFVF